MRFIQPRAMVQVGCTPLFGLYGDLHYPQAFGPQLCKSPTILHVTVRFILCMHIHCELSNLIGQFELPIVQIQQYNTSIIMLGKKAKVRQYNDGLYTSFWCTAMEQNFHHYSFRHRNRIYTGENRSARVL